MLLFGTNKFLHKSNCNLFYKQLIFLFLTFCNYCVLLYTLFSFLRFVITVQSLSCIRLFATPCIAACQASLSITNSWNLLRLMSIELVLPSNHFILCHPLLLLSSVFLNIRVFSSVSAVCIRWQMYWGSSFSISPSIE